MKRFVNILLIFIILTTLIPLSVSAVEYEVGTTFTYDIEVEMDGTSLDYSGYTESEDETRTYEIQSVSEDTVNWKLEREMVYSSNEGESASDYSNYYFSTSAETREYIEDSDIIEGWDDDYYVADYIWFRIHPDEVQIGDTVPVLGNNYEYVGQKAINLDTFKSVEAMKFEGSGHTDVYNNEYDPDGHLELQFTETFYFDPVTGYLLKSNWQADGYTSIGNFDWEETVKLTSSSFAVNHDWSAFARANSDFLITLVLLIVFVWLLVAQKRREWRNEVDQSFVLISGDYAPDDPIAPKHSAGPSTWNPLQVDYEYLLDDYGDKKKHGLKDGVYLIIETDNRLVLADTLMENYIGTQVLDMSEERLPMFYRLALGNIGAGSSEAALLRSRTQARDILKYYKSNTSDEIYQFDMITYETYMRLRRTPDERYEEIAKLLARRKVLDYSHGQAPLSPSSHIKKLEEVLKFAPKEVFLVGDDHLLSVSLARRGIKVTLVEIDPYTCALIETIKIEESLPIKVTQVDLRNPLPVAFLDKFDLFIADPDFTIESFILFLSRGMASLKVGGYALINFENSFGQRYKAKYALEQLKIKIHTEISEKWRYTIVQNKRIPIRGYRYGKYTIVDYANDLELSEAKFSSKMFVLEKTLETKLGISADMVMAGPQTSIYDY